MSLNLIDLRKAALREYPEFGQVPWPEPWYRNFLFWLCLVGVLFVIAQAVLAVLVGS